MKFWLSFAIVYDWIQILATGGFLKKIAEALPELKNKKVLDLGCGTGLLAPYLSPSGYLGVDVNPNFINLAKRKYPNYNFLVKDIVRHGYPKGGFDYCVVMNVLHHLTDKEMFQFFSKLKKWRGAKNLVIVESKPRGLIGNLLEKLDAGDNFRDHAILEEILRKAFKVEKIKTVIAPFKTYQYLVAVSKL